MFTRFSSVLVLALPLLAAAVAIPRSESCDSAPSNQCNTGTVQCCNSVQSASNPTAEVSALLGLLGLNAGDLTGQIGMNCSPITGAGAGGTSCTQQPVCCSNNNFNALIVIGCTPINITL